MSAKFTLTTTPEIFSSASHLYEALLFFADSIYESDKFELVLSRQELADFTGMSKESVSRIIRDLIDENIILAKGRTIEVLNKKKRMLLKDTE